MNDNTQKPNQGYSPSAVQSTPGLSSAVSNKYGQAQSFGIEQIDLSGSKTANEQTKENLKWDELLAKYGPMALSVINPALGILGQVAGQVYLDKKQDDRQQDAEKRANDEYQRRVDDERAYNSPQAQAERLLKAGINPLAVMTNGNGLTQHGISSVTPSSPTRGNLDIAGSIASLSSAGKSAAETQGQELENLYKGSTLVNRIEEVAATLKETQARANLLAAKAQYADALAANEFEAAKQSLLQMYRNYEKSGIDVQQANQDLQRGAIELAIAECTAKYEIDLKRLSIGELRASINLMNQQRSKLSVEEQNAIDFAVKELSLYDQRIEHQRKENQWYGANQVVGMITDVADSASGLISSVYGGPLKSLVSNTGTLLDDNMREERTTYTDKDGVTHTVVERSGRKVGNNDTYTHR